MSIPLPTGVVTFLFTDIEGSTRLWERHTAAMERALAHHDDLLRAAIESHGGHVVKTTGDGVLAAFESPAAALAAALAAQRGLKQTTDDRPPPTAPLLNTDPLTTDPLALSARMALHTGEAELREGDYHGTTLNRAARLMAIGHGGQVLLSGVTAGLLAAALPPGVALRDLGEFRLRDLAQPERVYQVAAEGLPADFPPLKATAARIRLPQPPTGFIGRWPEIDDILALLTAPDARLVSLVGPGGIGKTRLAIQAATTLAEREPARFPDGIVFVPLAHLNTAGAMVGAVADAIGFRFGSGEGEPRGQLLDHLRPRRALLILDNMEQLLADGGATLPAEVLAGAPGIYLLATTRSRLGIQGEQLYLVPGMSLPTPDAVRAWADPQAEAETFSGLRLFAQTAGRVRPGFRLDQTNIVPVCHICRLVQGMPLGIELAAGWLELLTPEEIAAEIERSLDLLATDLRDVPARQRSLRAVFETTWQLSTERERTHLPPLSVFRAPFTRQAAAAVAGAGPGDLLALVNKSWLQRVSGADGTSRFQMHELLRQYAADKLQADAEAEANTLRRFADHIVALVDECRPWLLGAHQREALAVMAADHAHILRAWEWLLEQGQFERLVDHLLLPLQRFAQMRGLLNATGELLARAIDACRRAGDRCPRRVLAALLLAGSTLHYGDADMVALLDEASDLAQSMAAPERELGGWYAQVVGFRRYRGDPDAQRELRQLAETSADETLAMIAAETLGLALMDDVSHRAILEESAIWLRRAGETYERRGDQWGLANICQFEGVVQGRLGNFIAAQASLDRAVAIFTSLEDWQNADAVRLLQSSAIARWRGRPEEALAEMTSALADIRARGDRVMEALALGRLSMELARYGDVDRARVVREQALALTRELAYHSNEPWNLWELGEVHRVAGSPAEARRLYTEAQAIFRVQGHGFGLAYYERGLGDLALMAGDYATAARHFTAARALMSEYPDQTWSMVYVTIGLARALNGDGQLTAAAATLYEALPTTANRSLTDLQPVLLATVAELALTGGRADAALVLCALLADHPLTWNETRPRVAALSERARATLGDAAAGAAEAHGRTLEVSALVAALAALPPDLTAWLDTVIAR